MLAKKVVARLKNDGREQDEEEHGGREALHALDAVVWQEADEDASDGTQKHDGE